MTAALEPGRRVGPQPAGAGPRRRRRGGGIPAGPAADARGSGWPRSGSSCSARPGRAWCRCLIDEGYEVFLDLKMADIPTTVQARRPGCSVPSAPPTSPCTPSPGPTVLRAGRGGLARRGRASRPARPAALAVTILTSDADAPPHILGKRVAAAVEAHCAGVVCAAADVREAKQLAPRLLAVVPGLRPTGAPVARPGPGGHPGRAIGQAGADLLVIGRAVTAARRPGSCRGCGLGGRRFPDGIAARDGRILTVDRGAPADPPVALSCAACPCRLRCQPTNDRPPWRKPQSPAVCGPSSKRSSRWDRSP